MFSGLPGVNGIPGSGGRRGKRGIPGNPGSPGKDGLPGRQGVKGDKGDRGPTGKSSWNGTECPCMYSCNIYVTDEYTDTNTECHWSNLVHNVLTSVGR